MDPIALQKQLKENASDLDQFYKELKNWGDDMKKKDEALKKSTEHATWKESSKEKQQKSLPSEKKVRRLNKESAKKNKVKIGYTDYAAWDKFDADAECEKVDYDENEESELSDECDEALRDQAYLEKEKGNKFVKAGNWEEAIACYTRAINHYSFDPVFYANRALCYLKKENMTQAEADCTMSLKLDSTYVKAYQRRAAAREVLNRLEDAEADLLKVLEIEPKNKETKDKLVNLRNKMKVKTETQRPISKFTASRNQKRNTYNLVNPNLNTTTTYSTKTNQEVESKACNEHWPSGIDNVIPVRTINKPVHLQSKKPLKRINIIETTDLCGNDETNAFPKPAEIQKSLKTDDLKVIERLETSKETKNQANTNKMKEEQVELFAPKNSVQFYSHWKYLKTLDEKYKYLKLIKPDQLPDIFKESLDSQIFSEILEVLAKCFIKHNEEIFRYLLFFSKMKRFSTFTMFMTDNDKNYLCKLFDYIKSHESHQEEVEMLIKKYEL